MGDKETERQRIQRQRLAQIDSQRQPLLNELKSDMLTSFITVLVCTSITFVDKTKEVYRYAHCLTYALHVNKVYWRASEASETLSGVYKF